MLRGAFLVLRFDLALPFPVGGVDGPTVRVVFRDAEPGCRLLERGYGFRRFKGGDHGVQRHEFGRGSGFGFGLGLDLPALLAEHVLDRLVVRVSLGNPMAVVTGDEPRTVPHFAQLLGEGGEKMSKSRGNVVNPNDIVAQYGADTMRLHIMFIGDFEKAVTWSNEAVKGSKRFLDRCWNLMELAQDSDEISGKNASIIHKTIKKVTTDIDDLKMNTAIAALMAMVNEFYSSGLTRGDLQQLMLMLSPFAPHMVEEMWELTGYAAKTGKMAMQMPWPTWDESKTVDSHVEMAVQINGKLKGTVTVAMDSDEETVKAAALALDKVQKAADGMTVVKTILVKNKLINLIVKPAK